MAIPQLVAHRGYTLHYPENTLLGIEAAIRAGARYVEVDIQLSADQVPILLHDKTLQRVCGIDGAAHNYTLAQLQQFKAMEFDRFGYRYASARLSTLTELTALLAKYPDVTAFIELKRISLERFGAITVLNRIRRELETIRSRCVIISFDLDALIAARHHWPKIGVVVDYWRERRQHKVKSLRPEYLFCDVDGLPRWGRLTFQESQVVIYEVADPALALSLADRGVNLIETFAIGEMHRALELASAA